MELPNDMKNNKFDIYHPRPGHRERFAQKLEKAFPSRKKKRNITPWLMAASIVVFLGIGIFSLILNRPINETDSMIQKNTAYFSSIIKKEIKELHNTHSPEAKELIKKTMQQLEKLEKEYEKITKDFKRNNENKSLLNAMIENFKKRIELLEFTKFQLKELQKQKTRQHVQSKA